ncbi:MAG: caspase family protein [Bacteroidetes bacterium]|nr:caspase family protein [Bacteroidota bacterium]
MNHPSAKALIQTLAAVGKADIATIYFSGHGFRANNLDYICINAKEHFPVKHLVTQAKRHVLIIDSCRTPLDTRLYGDIISGIGYHFPTSDPERARKLYNYYVANSPEGDALIFATEVNKPSLDTETGGVYTKSLMTVLHNWPDTEKERVMTIRQAFKRSVKVSKSYEQKQNPKLYYHRSQHATQIPFGVNLEAHSQ